jgi:hypothetical protein
MKFLVGICGQLEAESVEELKDIINDFFSSNNGKLDFFTSNDGENDFSYSPVGLRLDSYPETRETLVIEEATPYYAEAGRP